MSDVPVTRSSLRRLGLVIGEARAEALEDAAQRARAEMQGSTLWNVSSTAVGGGVAEMLRVLVGYILDADIETRWCVVSGDGDFFATTKRIHNQLHGYSFGEHLSEKDVTTYRRMTESYGRALAERVKPHDVVLLHDPQTTGMAPQLVERGAHVIWRCHVGTERPDGNAEAAWQLLRPYLEVCEAFVFSLSAYVPALLQDRDVVIIPPSIDPFSAKNRDLTDEEVRGILEDAGIVQAERTPPGVAGGHRPLVSRPARVFREQAPLDVRTPAVVQVSRWDRLKDMPGVMEGFLEHVPSESPAHLLLVGPDSAGVSDDPEGAEVFHQCRSMWEALDEENRRRVSLVCLPLDDVDENALMVNAVQRHATVVVQKSLAEGFGLTVAEAMWKGRAVVASGVGGISEQVTADTGVLLGDPSDLDAYGRTLSSLLADTERIGALGANAHRRVRDHYLGDRHLIQYGTLITRLRLRASGAG